MLQHDGCEDRKKQALKSVRGTSVETLADGWLPLLLTSCLAASDSYSRYSAAAAVGSVGLLVAVRCPMWIYLLYPVIRDEKLKQRNNKTTKQRLEFEKPTYVHLQL